MKNTFGVLVLVLSFMASFAQADDAAPPTVDSMRMTCAQLQKKLKALYAQGVDPVMIRTGSQFGPFSQDPSGRDGYVSTAGNADPLACPVGSYVGDTNPDIPQYATFYSQDIRTDLVPGKY